MPTTPRQQRELAIQARLWARSELDLIGGAARLVGRHLLAGAKGFLSDGPVGVSLALEGSAQEWFQLLVPHYTATGSSFGKRVLSRLGAEPADFTENLMRFVRSEGLTQAKGISDVTRAELRALIARGESEGFAVEKIARNIRKTVPTIGARRSRSIARTETHNAATFGSQEAARASGIDLEKIGVAHGGPRTRDTHAAADGQRRKLDEPFEVGGARLMRPGDSSLGAPAREVVECRCGEIHEPVAA